MCGIDLEIMVHWLNVDPKVRSVKQKKRAFENERNKAIKEEVEKLLRIDYIRPIQYPEWLANVVLVPSPTANGGSALILWIFIKLALRIYIRFLASMH
ncbi:UNVERIFIED_CONTAM: hypothetical protein Scaly_3008700 [Sesamum calycinum]|uniref:Uncharacterized protein n=1 Tax=Sesamum calycinum TaxID=2727403 RepID=A0AAW2KD96_9LAMI